MNFLHSYVYECGFDKQYIPFYVRAKVDSNIFKSKEQRKTVLSMKDPLLVLRMQLFKVESRNSTSSMGLSREQI